MLTWIFGRREDPCSDCMEIDGAHYCTMNCGPVVSAPQKEIAPMAYLRTPAGQVAVPEEFHRALRVAAAQAGKSIKAFITETLAEKIGFELENGEKSKP